DSVDAAREKILSMLASDDRVIHGEKHSIVNPLVEAGALPPPDLSPSVVVAEMADSAVKLQVRAWTDTGNYWDLFYTFNERIYKELPEAGIHFPFPQMDVHINPQS
ncbi:MAG: mechanosensitive ion channel family protein, partial [Candidatus Amulumruptor sp.]|nr:mechanosensitive ion channel family protein [Candidatus Amulumruptor sp.]